MVESLISKTLPEETIRTLVQNKDYGFDIKVMKNPDLKCTIVFTDGLSERNQAVKEGFEKFQKIELYFCLPHYAEVDKNHWSVHWINRIAEVPQRFETWFGPGDTVPAGNPPENIFGPFAANHFMIVEPIHLQTFFKQDVFANEGVEFLGLLPICQKELNYKLKNSWSVLLKKLQEKGISEMVDEFRTSVRHKRFFLF